MRHMTDDLEEELGSWPSFALALHTSGGGDVGARSKKDLYAYRNAIVDAGADDLPAVLKSAIEALASFK